MSGKLHPKIIESVVRRTAELLRENYLFPEVGNQMAEHITAHMEQGVYEDINKEPELGTRLTIDLRELSKDLHLAIYYRPQEAAALEERGDRTSEDEIDIHWWQQKAIDNFGLQKLEILTGNVGYIKILFFAPVSLAAERVTTAMAFLSDCAALIFDLRQCGGGDPYLVQLFDSYLFGSKPKLMMTFYDRPNDKTEQFWTLPHVPGKRMPDVPVYILTSSQTFSGGEDFAYVLKHHGRATIVGETTGGGGHTVEFMSAGNGFVLSLPTGQPIHPVTGGNWEGTGVEPDISIPQVQALQTAHLHALEALLEKCENENDSRTLQWNRARLKAKYQPLVLDDEQLEKLTGTYGSYQATFSNGQLTLGGKGRKDGWKLIPITETLFIVDEEYNAQFEIDPTGEVSAMVWLEIKSGREIRVPKEII